MNKTRVTLRDIADDLGLATITVSKAIRNHPDISKQTKARVQQRIRELNYQPNWAARSLATGKSFSIGVIVPDLVHPFFAEVVKGISEEVRAGGYSVMIASSEEDPAMERQQIEFFLGRQVDALILASAEPNHEIIELLVRRAVPFSLIDRRLEGADCNFVGVDDERVGFMATAHLIDVGCKRIAHIRGPDISTGIGRVKGYCAALESHRMKVRPEYIVSRTSSDTQADASGYEAMKRLISMQPIPDGVVCYNDPTALGAIKAIFKSGRSIPEDIAVIGAGNDRYASELRVPLSTVDQQHHMIGQRSARLVLRSIDAESPTKPRTILLTPELIVRDSTSRKEWKNKKRSEV
ncbi:MAG TPA: LacI family DNA-binding transcriptional regulator [Candidatus Koribacter sp.]|jgi:LacI family transcriptional regulator